MFMETLYIDTDTAQHKLNTHYTHAYALTFIFIDSG